MTALTAEPAGSSAPPAHPPAGTGAVPAPSGAVAAGSAAGAETVVQALGLTKRFAGGQVAVDGLDLSVPRGAVFGFLGPNGSGKTTTIRMLLGLVAPTAGTARLFGANVRTGGQAVLPRVGALVEGPAFHPYLSGAANLRRLDAADLTVARRGAARRVDAALDRVGLAAAAGKRYRSYSLGMRQRLGLAGALLRPRDLFVLDEPTNGLDPQGTREVRTLVREVSAEGATVVVSSHLLSEIEQICTHLGVMSRGRLVFAGPKADLWAAAGVRVRVQTPDTGRAAQVMIGSGTAQPVVDQDMVSAELRGAVPEELTSAMVGAGVRVRQLVVDRPVLEDLFVSLTGEGFDVEQ